MIFEWPYQFAKKDKKSSCSPDKFTGVHRIAALDCSGLLSPFARIPRTRMKTNGNGRENPSTFSVSISETMLTPVNSHLGPWSHKKLSVISHHLPLEPQSLPDFLNTTEWPPHFPPECYQIQLVISTIHSMGVPTWQGSTGPVTFPSQSIATADLLVGITVPNIGD